ncbi:MAG: ATP-binding cassette domain-containing protein [Pseudomonadales bacterium]
MLRADEVSFRRGDEVLFENLSFVVHPGQCVAVAGRNGVGKSTLFNLIRGQLSTDTGELSYPQNWQLGWLEQEVTPTQRPALDYVVDGHRKLREVEAQLEATKDSEAQALDHLELHSQYEDLGGYEAEAKAGEILSGLGFSTEDFSKPFADFSGGWRIRLNLAQALMSPCDLLLLDEPTNHLDLETIMWLEQWLKRFTGTVLIIAHDRAFLDACSDHTLYLSQRSGRLYSGNYSSCERQRAEQLAQEQAVQAKQQAQAAHIQQFVDRFRAKASKAKQVQSRIKALEKLQFTLTVQLDSPYSVKFKNPRQVSNPLFSLRKLALGYGDTRVLEDISQSVLPGDRIGVLGANGAGKTTLLRALVGDLPPQSGELVRGQHCAVGYFAQHQLESLNLEQTALSYLTSYREDWREQQCRDFLGGWGFNAEMITRPIRTLSGGEKARLVLAVIALDEPAVLVLDEPTNHLDLDMRDALALALQDYEGAVVIVSHDRTLLEKTVDELWLIADGGLQTFDGDLADYAFTRSSNNLTSNRKKGAENDRRQQRQVRASQRENLKAKQKEVRKLESDMQQQSASLSAIEVQLADKETYTSLPAEELDELLRQAGKLRAKLERTEARWLTLAEELEQSKSEV